MDIKPVLLREAQPMLSRKDTMSQQPVLRDDDSPPRRRSIVRPYSSLDTSDIGGAQTRVGPFVTQIYRDVRSWENSTLPHPEHYVVPPQLLEKTEPVASTFSPSPTLPPRRPYRARSADERPDPTQHFHSSRTVTAFPAAPFPSVEWQEHVERTLSPPRPKPFTRTYSRSIERNPNDTQDIPGTSPGPAYSGLRTEHTITHPGLRVAPKSFYKDERLPDVPLPRLGSLASVSFERRRTRSVSPALARRLTMQRLADTELAPDRRLVQTLQRSAARVHGVPAPVEEVRAALAAGGDAAVWPLDAQATPRAQHVPAAPHGSLYSVSPYRYTPVHPRLSTPAAPLGSGVRSPLYQAGADAAAAALAFFPQALGDVDSQADGASVLLDAPAVGRRSVSRPRLNSTPLGDGPPPPAPPTPVRSPLHRVGPVSPGMSVASRLLRSPTRAADDGGGGTISIGFGGGGGGPGVSLVSPGGSASSPGGGKVPGLALPALGLPRAGSGAGLGGGSGLLVPPPLVVQSATPRLHVPEPKVIVITPRPPEREQRPSAEDAVF